MMSPQFQHDRRLLHIVRFVSAFGMAWVFSTAWIVGLRAQCLLVEDLQIRSMTSHASDYFGLALALEGEWAILGASGRFADQGAVFAFREVNGEWLQEQVISASDGRRDDALGLAVALDQHRLVASAPYAEDGAGAVYVFEHNGNYWEEVQKITAAEVGGAKRLGRALALEGPHLLIGAQDTDVFHGAVFFLEHDGVRFQLVRRVDGAQSGSQIGASLAIRGDRALAGAPGEDAAVVQGGRVYEFSRESGSWQGVAILQPGVGQTYEAFGNSLDFYEDVALIGAPGAREGASIGSGRAYVFNRQAGAWVEEQILRDQETDYSRFGQAVQVMDQGKTLVVGQPGGDPRNIIDAGNAIVFRRHHGTWSAVAELTSSNEGLQQRVGTSLSADGDRVLIGQNEVIDYQPVGTSGFLFTLGELFQDVLPRAASAGEALLMTTCDGEPGAPTILAVVSVNGAPFFFNTGLAVFDGNGERFWAAQVPPGLAGSEVELQAFGVSASGAVGASRQVRVTFE